VIALDQELEAGHLTDAFKVRHSIVESHCPAGVTDYENKIFFMYNSRPRVEYFPVMVAPVLTEAIHRLSGSSREVKVADCEYFHGA
jgi:hypothetical protein